MLKYLFLLGISLISHMSAGENVDTLELLDAEDYASAKHFFADFEINGPILYSMLENKSQGKVFTDNKMHPSFMLACSPAGYVFLGGKPDHDSLKKIALYLKTLPHVSLVSPLDWRLKDFFLREGFTAVDRIQFQRDASSFDLNKIPYSIKRIDKEIFSRCNWYSFILSNYGDSERFFSNGIGFCLMDQGKILSESYGLIADDKAEIGVVTDANYRGQNLGTSVCEVMLDYCDKHHIEAFWSCNADHFASIAIAKKLRFKEDCRYFFLTWVAPICYSD